MSHRNATAAVMIETAPHTSFCTTEPDAIGPHVCTTDADNYVLDGHTLRMTDDGRVIVPGLYGAAPVFDPATGRASVNLHTIGEGNDDLRALFAPAAARALAAQLLAAADEAEAVAR